jgi:transposase
MSRRPRRNHTSAFKAKVAIAAIKGDRTLVRLAGQFDVHPNQLSTWKNQLLEGAAEVFATSYTRGRHQGAAREDRRTNAGERFLRNDDARCRLHGLENESECLGAPMQIVHYPRAVACLVERRAGVDVLHSVTHCVVE